MKWKRSKKAVADQHKPKSDSNPDKTKMNADPARDDDRTTSVSSPDNVTGASALYSTSSSTANGIAPTTGNGTNNNVVKNMEHFDGDGVHAFDERVSGDERGIDMSDDEVDADVDDDDDEIDVDSAPESPLPSDLSERRVNDLPTDLSFKSAGRTNIPSEAILSQ